METKEKQHFIVVLSDADSSIEKSMLDRLKKIGDVNSIMDNVYLLSCENSSLDMSKIRNDVAGEERGHCIVFRFDNKIAFAWSLYVDQSDLLNKVVKEVHHEGK